MFFFFIFIHFVNIIAYHNIVLFYAYKDTSLFYHLTSRPSHTHVDLLFSCLDDMKSARKKNNNKREKGKGKIVMHYIGFWIMYIYIYIYIYIYYFYIFIFNKIRGKMIKFKKKDRIDFLLFSLPFSFLSFSL